MKCVGHIPGILCILLIYWSLVIINYTVVLNSYNCYYHLIPFQILAFLILMTHARTAYSNPGQMPKGYMSLDHLLLPAPFSTVCANTQLKVMSNEELNSFRAKQFPPSDLNPPPERADSLFNRALLKRPDSNADTESFAYRIDQSLSMLLEDRGGDAQLTQRSESAFTNPINLDQNGIPLDETQFQRWKKKVKDILNKKCDMCENVKPPRTHHCSVCNTCIVRMDHHCPWINNCVGRYNQKHFLQFLCVAVLGCLYSLVFLGYRCIQAFINDDLAPLVGNPLCYWQFCFLLYSLIVSVMFFIFALDLFLDQLSCIAHNTSIVDRKSTPKLHSEFKMYDSLKEVFGCEFGCSWFLPTSVNSKLCVEEQYCWANFN